MKPHLADLFKLTPFATTFRYEDEEELLSCDRHALRMKITQLHKLIEDRTGFDISKQGGLRP